MAVSKCNQYLMGRSFTVKTDQKALKFLLEQKLHTGSQLKWITKLMQYDFTIEYKKVKENKSADALSRLPLVELAALTLSTIKTDLLSQIMQSWSLDDELISLIQELKEKKSEVKGYSFVHKQLRKNRKLVIRPDGQLRKEIMRLWHNSVSGGHSGLSHPYSNKDLTKIFMEQIHKLHGMIEDIVNDRDPIFTSKLWQELFSMQGVTLSTSTTYHLQSIGQTKVTTPYEALYGQSPPLHLPYVAGDSTVEEVDKSLLTKEFKFQLLKYHLQRAQ
ncbi:uncharacterized protein LOC142162304 [Nicotiana tabacum]|uniref:Uncharacterized protein LOC142162304 n=1 Tax=Nicotiana tabacum TaxID=4097 RepID=A0AC58RPT0_TOBAC